MSWNDLVKLIFGATLSVPQPNSPPVEQVRVQADEVLAYECARSVSTLVRPEDQLGPVFGEKDLIFTSLIAEDLSHLLIVSAGRGNFVVRLEGAGVQRLRFHNYSISIRC